MLASHSRNLCLGAWESEINSPAEPCPSEAPGKICPFSLWVFWAPGVSWLEATSLPPACGGHVSSSVSVCPFSAQLLQGHLSLDLRLIHFIQNDLISRRISWLYLQRLGHIYRLQGSRTYLFLFSSGSWGWGSPIPGRQTITDRPSVRIYYILLNFT